MLRNISSCILDGGDGDGEGKERSPEDLDTEIWLPNEDKWGKGGTLQTAEEACSQSDKPAESSNT